MFLFNNLLYVRVYKCDAETTITRSVDIERVNDDKNRHLNSKLLFYGLFSRRFLR